MIKEVVSELEGRVGSTYLRDKGIQMGKTIQAKIRELTGWDI